MPERLTVFNGEEDGVDRETDQLIENHEKGQIAEKLSENVHVPDIRNVGSRLWDEKRLGSRNLPKIEEK